MVLVNKEDSSNKTARAYCRQHIWRGYTSKHLKQKAENHAKVKELERH